MKCRYNKCKLGGEVEKEDAVKNGSMYYHEECYNKNELKKELRGVMSKFPKRDINIALSKAIDESPHSLGYIKYIVNNRITKFQNAYGLLYQLKFESNYEEYVKKESGRVSSEINMAIKDMDIEIDKFKFEHKPSKNRFDIY